ncbi:MAG: hypothetical protein LC778_10380 [Acidobacteria bacterium]|nr:hypothetical protein [Acidobacteriota bacterium]
MTGIQILAEAIINAWRNNEPDDLLLRELLYRMGVAKDTAHYLVTGVKNAHS